MEHKDAQAEQPKQGLVAGLLGIARNLLGLIINRIELASVEMSEIGGNVIRFLVLFMMASIALWFAVAFWSILLAFLAWDALGWKILVVLGTFFTIATLVIAWYARSLLRRGVFSLPSTMAELRKDRDALL